MGMIGSLGHTSTVRVNTLQYLVPQCEIASSVYLSHKKEPRKKLICGKYIPSSEDS